MKNTKKRMEPASEGRTNLKNETSSGRKKIQHQERPLHTEYSMKSRVTLRMGESPSSVASLLIPNDEMPMTSVV